MRLSDIGELILVDGIRKRFSKALPGVITGIGDDSAVLRADRRNLLLTTDMMVEGVHFDRALMSPFQMGFKLVSANASDIYAMGGRPRFMLLNIAAPASTAGSFIKRLLDGVEEAAGLYGVSLVGGDVSSSQKGLVLSASIAGYARRPVGRRGALAGEGIYVTGPLGDSACGLAIVRAIGRPVEIEKGKKAQRPLKWNLMEPLLRRHLMPLAKRPPKNASAMIDISDGLFLDLARLLDESGAGAKIYTGRIPMSEEMRAAASFLGLEPLKLAASGGEDYELLYTAPLGREKRGDFFIGEVTKKGRVAVDARGRKKELAVEGYRHFGLQGKV